jgi:hypothetical protein
MTDNVTKLVDGRVKREMAARQRAGIAADMVRRPKTEAALTEILNPAIQTLGQSATVFDLTIYFTSRG